MLANHGVNAIQLRQKWFAGVAPVELERRPIQAMRPIKKTAHFGRPIANSEFA
jgi:hypothetical protein